MANQRSPEGSIVWSAPWNSRVASVKAAGGYRSLAKRKPPWGGWWGEKSMVGAGGGVGWGVGSGVADTVAEGVAAVVCSGVRVLVGCAVVGEGVAASLPPQVMAAASAVSSQRVNRAGRTNNMVAQSGSTRR